MSDAPTSLSAELGNLTSALSQIQQRLHGEAPPDPGVLNEFRHVVDSLRFTAWAVSELINAQHTSKNLETVRAFLAAERLRRLEQLVRDLCQDIDRGAIKLQFDSNQSLAESLDALQARTAQTNCQSASQKYGVKSAG